MVPNIPRQSRGKLGNLEDEAAANVTLHEHRNGGVGYLEGPSQPGNAIREQPHHPFRIVVGQTPAAFDRGLDAQYVLCLLYTSPSPRDGLLSRMPSSA